MLMRREFHASTFDCGLAAPMDEAMERRAFFSNELHPSTAPFSHFVRVGDPGFVSGIIGQNRDDGALVSADVSAQFETLVDHVETLPGELGLELRHSVRTTMHLTDYAGFGALNAAYERRLSAPYPARTTVQVAGLPLGAERPDRPVVAFPCAGGRNGCRPATAFVRGSPHRGTVQLMRELRVDQRRGGTPVRSMPSPPVRGDASPSLRSRREKKVRCVRGKGLGGPQLVPLPLLRVVDQSLQRSIGSPGSVEFSACPADQRSRSAG